MAVWQIAWKVADFGYSKRFGAEWKLLKGGAG